MEYNYFIQLYVLEVNIWFWWQLNISVLVSFTISWGRTNSSKYINFDGKLEAELEKQTEIFPRMLGVRKYDCNSCNQSKLNAWEKSNNKVELLKLPQWLTQKVLKRTAKWKSFSNTFNFWTRHCIYDEESNQEEDLSEIELCYSLLIERVSPDVTLIKATLCNSPHRGNYKWLQFPSWYTYYSCVLRKRKWSKICLFGI